MKIGTYRGLDDVRAGACTREGLALERGHDVRLAHCVFAGGGCPDGEFLELPGYAYDALDGHTGRVNGPVARGYLGGQDGAPGELLLSDGTHPHPKRKYRLQPDQTLTLRLPGGGGFHPPWERDSARVLDDVRQGLVSAEAALERYGVVLNIEQWSVDEAATVKKRAELKTTQEQQ